MHISGRALAKTDKATPYVAQGRRFRKFLELAQTIHATVEIEQIRTDLLAAAGFSDKAQSHLSDEELTPALERVVGAIAEQQPDEWRQELLYRFLLTMARFVIIAT